MMLRAISLWQPWATLLVIGEKVFETRSWYTEYAGPLLIHAAKHKGTFERDFTNTAMVTASLRRGGYGSYDDLPFGAIIGRVELVKCWPTAVVDKRICEESGEDSQELVYGNFDPGRIAWECRKPQHFGRPLPWKGSQGFFGVPGDIVARHLCEHITAALPKEP